MCTLPLGVLKGWNEQSAVSFEPPLSEPKQQAIERLGTRTHNPSTTAALIGLSV